MYKKLNEIGEVEIILGDGPDETMSGYARDLIINHLYDIYNLEAFEHYKPLIDKILPPKSIATYASLSSMGNVKPYLSIPCLTPKAFENASPNAMAVSSVVWCSSI